GAGMLGVDGERLAKVLFRFRPVGLVVVAVTDVVEQVGILGARDQQPFVFGQRAARISRLVIESSHAPGYLRVLDAVGACLFIKNQRLLIRSHGLGLLGLRVLRRQLFGLAFCFGACICE